MERHSVQWKAQGLQHIYFAKNRACATCIVTINCWRTADFIFLVLHVAIANNEGITIKWNYLGLLVIINSL